MSKAPTVASLAADLAQGRTTSAALTEAALDRIADPAVHELCDLVCGSIGRRLEATVAERAAFNPAPAKAAGGRPARR